MEPREVAWRIYRESLPILGITLLGGLFAGAVLDALVPYSNTFPGLLVAVPVFLATRGNVYGALGGRISSGLHQGLIEPRFSRDERLVRAVIASFINALGVSIVIALLSWGVLRLLGRAVAPLGVFLVILFAAGLLTSVTMIAGLLGLIFAGYRLGYDPDNLVGPIVTTLGDVFGMLFLFLAVLAVDRLPAILALGVGS